MEGLRLDLLPLHDGLQRVDVLEVFDEAGEGPYLFPRDEAGKPDAIKRAAIKILLT